MLQQLQSRRRALALTLASLAPATPRLTAQIPDVEVWFQRASDVVRKLRLGDIDLGIVGFDMFSEIGDGDRCAV